MPSANQGEWIGALLPGGYRLLGLLGRGGSSLVFEARSEQGERVAVKMLAARGSAAPAACARLRREAELGRLLRHPGVPKTRFCGELADGSPFFVMELIEGESLSFMALRRGHLPWHEVAWVAGKLCTILEAAHARAVVHRDIKAEHVMLSPLGAHAVRVALLDFGIAQVGQASSTGAMPLLGTPGYAAPGQALGDPQLDGRADLFSVGILLYEALSGREAYGQGNAAVLLRRVLTEDLAPLASVRPDLPATLCQLVDRLCARAVDERPHTARGVAQQLLALAGAHAEPRLARRILAIDRRETIEPPSANARTRELLVG